MLKRTLFALGALYNKGRGRRRAQHALWDVCALWAVICVIWLCPWAYAETPQVNLALISQIESSNRPQAIGDNGRAYGLYQIHPELVQDYNRLNKTSLAHEEMFRPETASQVASWAFNSYYPLILKRLHKPVTVTNLLTCFNAGCGAVKAGNLPTQYLRKYTKLGGKL